MRNLLYFSIKFGPQIGSGATAQVYKGTYRGHDVAIKVYTPDHIDLDLLRSFADEIKIMIPLMHRNVAAVTGLSVMPPHIVIVLPMYVVTRVNQNKIFYNSNTTTGTQVVT